MRADNQATTALNDTRKAGQWKGKIKIVVDQAGVQALLCVTSKISSHMCSVIANEILRPRAMQASNHV
jgi:hypothetical protein